LSTPIEVDQLILPTIKEVKDEKDSSYSS